MRRFSSCSVCDKRDLSEGKKADTYGHQDLFGREGLTGYKTYVVQEKSKIFKVKQKTKVKKYTNYMGWLSEIVLFLHKKAQSIIHGDAQQKDQKEGCSEAVIVIQRHQCQKYICQGVLPSPV